MGQPNVIRMFSTSGLRQEQSENHTELSWRRLFEISVQQKIPFRRFSSCKMSPSWGGAPFFPHEMNRCQRGHLLYSNKLQILCSHHGPYLVKQDSSTGLCLQGQEPHIFHLNDQVYCNVSCRNFSEDLSQYWEQDCLPYALWASCQFNCSQRRELLWEKGNEGCSWRQLQTQDKYF